MHLVRAWCAALANSVSGACAMTAMPFFKRCAPEWNKTLQVLFHAGFGQPAQQQNAFGAPSPFGGAQSQPAFGANPFATAPATPPFGAQVCIRMSWRADSIHELLYKPPFALLRAPVLTCSDS